MECNAPRRPGRVTGEASLLQRCQSFFSRPPGKGPTLYPVACPPQAWSIGAVFLLLQGCLGLTIDAASHRIRLSRPVLPAYLREIRIRGLAVDDGSADLVLRRHPHDVAVRVQQSSRALEVVSVS